MSLIILFLNYLGVVLFSLWLYKVIYNIFFSPLRKVPGPLIYQFFPILYILKRINGKYPFISLELHRKYGNAVRTGWNAVSFSSKESIKDIYSTYQFKKNIIYKGMQSVGETTLTTLCRDFHRNRKKILNHSFSESSISSLEPLFNEVGVKALVKKLKEESNFKQDIDLGLGFHSMSFDVIGEFAFGKSFDMIEHGHHPILKWIKELLFHSAIRSTFPIINFYMDSGSKNLYKFAYESIKNAETHSGRNTILQSFLEARDPETGVKLTEKEVAEESILQLFAGTDTTSNSLIWIFFLLLKHPDKYDKLSKEILEVFPDKESITFKACKDNCPYLKAVIHEGMRILPVVAGTLPRDTPKGGKVIDGYYMPEGTIVGTSLYALNNLEENYSNPDEYLPERWLDSNNNFVENDSFMPFLIGPRACLGRTLAWMMLNLTVCSLIRNFEFKLVDKDLEIDAVYFVVLQPSKDKLMVSSKVRD